MNNKFTLKDLEQAKTDPNMSSIQRYTILSYFGLIPYDIRKLFHDLSKAKSQEEQASKQQEQQVKKQVEKIVENTINDITKKFKERR